MKNQILKVLAVISAKCVKVSNNTTCYGWTYQPKAPDKVKDFKK